MACKVWIVEVIFLDGPQRWEPTIGAALTRDDARGVLHEWRKCVAEGDKLRIRKYVTGPEASAARKEK